MQCPGACHTFSKPAPFPRADEARSLKAYNELPETGAFVAPASSLHNPRGCGRGDGSADVRGRGRCSAGFTGSLSMAVQINAGTEALDGEEFGDDNFDFDE